MKKDEVGKTIGYITHPEETDTLFRYLIEEFEADADEYTKQYNDLKQQVKYIRKYIFIKLACLPIELVLGYIILGKLEVRARLMLAKKLYNALKTDNFSSEKVSELYELC